MSSKALRLLALGACMSHLACNATCIRDSDCLGTSICTQNRCILVVRGDAGAVPTPASSPNDATRDTAGNDAGSTSMRLDAGAR